MSLRQKVVHALYWTGGTRLLGQAITWLITLFVIRLLTPDDYGLLALATVFVGFLFVLAEAGLGSALVQAPRLDEKMLRPIFAAVIVMNGSFAIALIGAAPFLASFFSDGRLTLVLQVLSTQLFIGIFSVIPTAILTRALDFRRLSLCGLVAGVCGSLCTLLLALAGLGVWSLVGGSLLGTAINTIALNLMAPFFKRPDFSLAGARSLLVFGGQVTSARILWYLYSQADVVIAGKLLGRELLGVYSVAMHLASLPVQKLSSILNQVAFPAFAHTQHDRALVAQYTLKSLALLWFVAVPVLWGISSIAPEIVAVILGTHWHAAVLPLTLLPLVMPLTMVSPFLNTAMQGIGHGGIVLRNVITASVILPFAFVIGARWGLLGLSLAWVLGFPLVLGVNLRRMLPLLGLRTSEVLSAAARTAVAGCGMYAIVMLTRYAAQAMEPPARMALLVAAGGVSYCGISWALNRQRINELTALFSGRRAA